MDYNYLAELALATQPSVIDGQWYYPGRHPYRAPRAPRSFIGRLLFKVWTWL